MVTLTLNCEASKVSGSTNLGLWTEWRTKVQGQIHMHPHHTQTSGWGMVHKNWESHWVTFRQDQYESDPPFTRSVTEPAPQYSITSWNIPQTRHYSIIHTYIHTRYTQKLDKLSSVAALIFLNYMVHLLSVDCRIFGCILDTYQITGILSIISLMAVFVSMWLCIFLNYNDCLELLDLNCILDTTRETVSSVSLYSVKFWKLKNHSCKPPNLLSVNKEI